MHSVRWLIITGLLILGAGSLLAVINATVDVYGLFKPTQRCRLGVYGDARVAKYLLSRRYVPDNFNAILVGGSFSANWDMTRLSDLRIYNESLNGGNIVEEKALTEAAIAKNTISTAFVLVHPALTYSHEYMTVKLDSKLVLSSLGSLSLFYAYKDMLYIRLHRSAQNYDYAGTEDFGTLATVMNANMKQFWNKGDYFEIDPIALGAYRDLIGELRDHRVRIVYIVPPTFEGLLQSKKLAFEQYVRLIKSYSTPDEKWIDFRSDAYLTFRTNHSNFPDGVHMIPEAAKQVVSFIDEQLKNRANENTVAAVR